LQIWKLRQKKYYGTSKYIDSDVWENPSSVIFVLREKVTIAWVTKLSKLAEVCGLWIRNTMLAWKKISSFKIGIMLLWIVIMGSEFGNNLKVVRYVHLCRTCIPVWGPRKHNTTRSPSLCLQHHLATQVMSVMYLPASSFSFFSRFWRSLSFSKNSSSSYQPQWNSQSYNQIQGQGTSPSSILGLGMVERKNEAHFCLPWIWSVSTL
jgi:hypothetical protein